MNPGGRGTQSGGIWEKTIVPAMNESYPARYQRQVTVGDQLFGGVYIADFVVDGIIVSAKWQQVAGTVEQKLLYDIASLIDIIKNGKGKYRKAYVVLGGVGFRPITKVFLLAQKHRNYLRDGELVEVVSLDDFIGRVNKQAL